MTFAASVRWDIRPARARTCIAVALEALAIGLALSPVARANNGGAASPGSSLQLTPASVPSGGQWATAGGMSSPARKPSEKVKAPVRTEAPVTASAPAAPARTVTVRVTALAGSAGARHREKPPAAPRTRQERRQRTYSTRDPGALFLANLKPPFHLPGPASAAGRHAGEALGLAAVALLLLVVTGLLVMRTTTQPRGPHRPA